MNSHDDAVSVAVSSCLLGHPVRYDGEHCQDAYIIGTLSRFLKLSPVCPESAIGLGTPRPPVQLVAFESGTHAIGKDKPHLDITQALTQFAHSYLDEHPHIIAFILKSKSPSCGVGSTKIYNPDGSLLGVDASGLFADTITTKDKLLVVNDTELQSTQQRLHYLVRLYALANLRRARHATACVQNLHLNHQRYLPLFMRLVPDPSYWQSISHALEQKSNKQAIDHYYRKCIQAIHNPMDRSLFHDYLWNALVKLQVDMEDHKLAKALADYKEGMTEWPDVTRWLSDRIERTYKRQYNQWNRIIDLFPLELLGLDS